MRHTIHHTSARREAIQPRRSQPDNSVFDDWESEEELEKQRLGQLWEDF